MTGFMLTSQGDCDPCDKIEGCLSCSENKCNLCKDGYFLNNRKCQRCDQTMPHCTYCTDAQTCNSCEENITVLKDNSCECN